MDTSILLDADTILAVAAVITAIAGLVKAFLAGRDQDELKDKVESLRKELDGLKGENDALQKRLNVALKENDELRVQNNILAAINNEYREKVLVALDRRPAARAHG